MKSVAEIRERDCRRRRGNCFPMRRGKWFSLNGTLITRNFAQLAKAFAKLMLDFAKMRKCSKSVISPEAHYLEVRQTFFQGINHFVVALRIRRLQEEAGFDQQWQ